MTTVHKEAISIEVIRILYSLLSSVEKFDKRNHFHSVFSKAFQEPQQTRTTNVPLFVNLGDWYNGLDDTIGHSFFKEISHILSTGISRTFSEIRGNQLKISKSQKKKNSGCNYKSYQWNSRS